MLYRSPLKTWAMAWAGLMLSLPAGAFDLVGTQKFTAYEPTYLVAGYADLVQNRTFDWLNENTPLLGETLSTRQLFKLGFSVKYQLFSEFRSGLFLAYTQTLFWNLLGESSPFVEANYNPELFWRFQTRDNFANNLDLNLMDHLQIGVSHNSTGVAGPDSRGFDQIYAQIGLGWGEASRFELSFRTLAYFHQFLPPDWYQGETADIQNHRSNYLLQARVQIAPETLFFIPQELRLQAAPGGGAFAWDWSRGYLAAQLSFGTLFGGLSPFVQMHWGSGEGLVAYGQSGLALRLGVRAR